MSCGSTPARERGVTYLAVLFFIAASGAMLAATGIIWSHERQRQKDEELLWVGNQFKEAIGLYYQRSPGTIKRYPEQLEDLLLDKRYLTTQRYLRRLYRDPITGKSEWGTVAAPGGGIMGVHSLSEQSSVKLFGLAGRHRPISGTATYSAWRFVYLPPTPEHTGQLDPLDLRSAYGGRRISGLHRLSMR